MGVSIQVTAGFMAPKRSISTEFKRKAKSELTTRPHGKKIMKSSGHSRSKILAPSMLIAISKRVVLAIYSNSSVN
jgi:hypothetical protein